MLQTFTAFESTENFKSSKINIDIMISIIISIRNLRSELNIPYKKSINIFIETKNINIKNFLMEYEKEIKRLLKVSNIFYENLSNKNKSAFIILSNLSLLIPLDDIVDTNKEIEKLNKKKEIKKQKLISIVSKLNNTNFTEKAPENVIENFKLQEKDLKSSIEKIDQIINTIN